MIVLTDTFATISRLVRDLSAQTIAGQVELVVGCPNRADVVFPPGAIDSLSRVTVVEAPFLPMGRARATAVRSTSAPIVVLGETHAYPAPDWAEHLLRAYEGGWASVTPGMENGNPETARSWSGFLMDYGRWLANHAGGGIDEPPAYNASWRRDALTALGDRLPLMLEPGGPMDHQLTANHARFHHEPLARIAHLNVVPWGAWAAERYWGGRLFGARRSHGWSLARRLVYFGGSVLVPALRFARTRPAIARARSQWTLPSGINAVVAAGSVAWGLGEAMGYLAGEGPGEARMCEYELHKERYS